MSIDQPQTATTTLTWPALAPASHQYQRPSDNQVVTAVNLTIEVHTYKGRTRTTVDVDYRLDYPDKSYDMVHGSSMPSDDAAPAWLAAYIDAATAAHGLTTGLAVAGI